MPYWQGPLAPCRWCGAPDVVKRFCDVTCRNRYWNNTRRDVPAATPLRDPNVWAAEMYGDGINSEASNQEATCSRSLTDLASLSTGVAVCQPATQPAMNGAIARDQSAEVG